MNQIYPFQQQQTGWIGYYYQPSNAVLPINNNPAAAQTSAVQEAPSQKTTGCSARTAAGYVGLIEIIFIAAMMSIYAQFFFNQTDPAPELISGMVVGVISVATALGIIVTMFIGLCRQSSFLIMPHLIAQIVAVCLMTAFGTIVMLNTFTGSEFRRELGTMFPSVVLSIGVLCLGMALAEVWFFFLVRDCYYAFRLDEQQKKQFRLHQLKLQRLYQTQTQQPTSTNTPQKKSLKSEDAKASNKNNQIVPIGGAVNAGTNDQQILPLPEKTAVVTFQDAK